VQEQGHFIVQNEQRNKISRYGKSNEPPAGILHFKQKILAKKITIQLKC
jgi:hypothetical protein